MLVGGSACSLLARNGTILREKEYIIIEGT